jgi:hypothetical protein
MGCPCVKAELERLKGMASSWFETVVEVDGVGMHEVNIKTDVRSRVMVFMIHLCSQKLSS